MDIDVLILVLDTVGTLLIAWAALSVHRRVLHEHKIDDQVFRTMKVEQFFGYLGVILVVVSFFLEMSMI